MVRHIRVAVSDDEYEKLADAKDGRTWSEAMLEDIAGVDSADAAEDDDGDDD